VKLEGCDLILKFMNTVLEGTTQGQLGKGQQRSQIHSQEGSKIYTIRLGSKT